MAASGLGTRYLAGCAVAREAGRLAGRYLAQLDTLTVEQKSGPQDLVSEADRAAERLIVDRLGSAFPDDRFLGEEGGGDAAERLWVIDPIDGTANFLRRIPYFSISIAYVERGVTELGFVYDPVGDELFAARRGSGATRDGQPIQVSGCDDLAHATVGTSHSFSNRAEPFLEALERLIARGCDFRRLGSTALLLAHTADGRFDGYINPGSNSWDALAGMILVREAGGWTNDFLVDGGLLERTHVIACTPGLKEALVSVARFG